MMAVIFNILFCAQIICFQFFWEFPTQPKLPTLLMTLIFLFGIMFNPFNMFHRPARIEICKTLGHVIVAPFGWVKFRHFFMADVITSAKIMLSDATSMVCFYTDG